MKVNDAARTWTSKLFSFLPQGIFKPVGHVNLHKRPYSLSVMLGCAQGCVCSGYYKEIKLECQDSRQAKNSIQHGSLCKTGFLVEWFLFYGNKNVIEYLLDNCRVSCCCCCTFKGFKSLWSKY